MSTPVSSPVVFPAPLPSRRPTGEVVAAVALAVMAFFVLIVGGFMMLSALVIPTPAEIQFAVKAFETGFGAVALLIAAFCAWTVVDLLRMKAWARISITVLGALLACFSALMSLLYFVLAFTGSFLARRVPGISPDLLRGILGGFGVFYLGLALVGVWWLVYFSLARTRRCFAARRGIALVGVAETEAAAGEEKQGAGVVGILVNCLAGLYIVNAAVMAVLVPIGFPPMFFGHVFRGSSGTVVWVGFGVLCLVMGVGLIRRMKAAWVTAIVVNVLGVLSQLMMLEPYGREQMLEYQQELTLRLHAVTVRPTASVLTDFAVIAGVVAIVAVLWLLFLARGLFEPKSA